MKGVYFPSNCKITPIFEPWKVVIPFAPKHTNFFVEGEGEDESSLREQIIYEGIEEVKKLPILEI
jgi:hypothetical protein